MTQPTPRPASSTIDGQRQLIMGTGDGRDCGAFQPRTGKQLWRRYDFSRRGTLRFAVRHWLSETSCLRATAKRTSGDAANVMGGVVPGCGFRAPAMRHRSNGAVETL